MKNRPQCVVLDLQLEFVIKVNEWQSEAGSGALWIVTLCRISVELQIQPRTGCNWSSDSLAYRKGQA